MSAGVASMLGAPTIARAEERTLRLVVPFGPGGANDLMGRVAAEALGRTLGRPVIVENRPGAGSLVGAEYVARSRPDGSVLLVGAVGTLMNASLIHASPSGAAGLRDDDLVSVSMIGSAPSLIVVSPEQPYTTLRELLEAGRRTAVPLNWATAGVGSTPHFVAQLLAEASGVSLNLVPYRSGADSITAVIGNTVAATSEASVVVLPHWRAGRLRALASTHASRIAAAPDVPTCAEVGWPQVRIGHWAGLFAPRDTPAGVLNIVAQALQAGLSEPAARNRLTHVGIEPMAQGTEAFARFVQSERERLRAIAKRTAMHEG